jgi:hypothetical protein
LSQAKGHPENRFPDALEAGARVSSQKEIAMPKSFARRDFLVKDLVVSIGSGSRGGTWLPGPDDETPPSPISPIASVLANLALIEAVRGTILDAVKAKRFDEVARAFVPGDAGGSPAIRSAINEIGTAVVASAAWAALGGGSVGLPNPDCGGTSLETIPPTLTPIVHVGLAVHRVTELPRLKQQLAQTVAFVEKAAAAQAPRGDEVAAVRAQLEAALKSLPR